MKESKRNVTNLKRLNAKRQDHLDRVTGIIYENLKKREDDKVQIAKGTEINLRRIQEGTKVLMPEANLPR